MTEKEKMLNGLPYNPRDPELIKMYHIARKLMKAYNNLDSELTDEREEILTDMLQFKGTGVWIGGNTVILPGIIIGINVTIGAGSVVTKNIPDDMLAFGNPCTIQRKL